MVDRNLKKVTIVELVWIVVVGLARVGASVAWEQPHSLLSAGRLGLSGLA